MAHAISRSLRIAPFAMMLTLACARSSGRTPGVRASLTGAPVIVGEGEPIRAKLILENTGSIPVRIPNERFQGAFVEPMVCPLLFFPIKDERTWAIELSDGEADTLQPGQRVSRFIDLPTLKNAWIYQAAVAINGVRPLGESEGAPRRHLRSSSVWLLVIPKFSGQS